MLIPINLALSLSRLLYLRLLEISNMILELVMKIGKYLAYQGEEQQNVVLARPPQAFEGILLIFDLYQQRYWLASLSPSMISRF